MTVPVQTPTITYIANGATAGPFAFPFKIMQADDLQIFLNGTRQTSGFTVTGIGNDSGGDVTFGSIPAAGTTILIKRYIPLERVLFDYQTNGDLLAKTINNDFDRIWMALQDVGYYVGNGDPATARALLLGDGDVSGSGSYRALQNKIQDLADPVNSQDAVNLRTMQQALADFVSTGGGDIVMQLLKSLDVTLGVSLVGGAARVASSIAELRTFKKTNNQLARTKGYYAPGDGGLGEYRLDLADTTSVDNGGTVIIASDGGCWKLQHNGHVSIKQFGAKSDGTDCRSIVINAMSVSVQQGFELTCTVGTYSFSNWVPLPSKLKLRFEQNALWKLSGSTTVGGFVIGGYDINLNKIAFDDVDIHGISLDCAGLAGENGFNAINATRVRIYKPKILNTLISTSTQGGKAFQFEGATVDGVHVFEPYIENCTIGINSHADPTAGTEVARHITYYDVVMRNVDVPFNVDGQFATPENGTPSNMSTFVQGANLFNCGRLTYSGASPTGGGIICGDRGFGLKVSGLRIVNTAAYGSIGGVFRGTLFDVNLTDAKIEIPGATAIMNLTPVTYGSASSGVYPCTVTASDVEYRGDLSYVAIGFANGKVGSCKLDVTIDSNVATSMAGICDSESTFNGLGMLKLNLSNANYRSTGLQPLFRLFSVGNSVNSCFPEYEEGIWTPSDASGASIALTITGQARYVRQGRLVTCVCQIAYAGNSSGAGAVIGGLPYTAAAISGIGGGASVAYTNEPTLSRGYVAGNSKNIVLSQTSGASVVNSALAGKDIRLVISYMAAN